MLKTAYMHTALVLDIFSLHTMEKKSFFSFSLTFCRFVIVIAMEKEMKNT